MPHYSSGILQILYSSKEEIGDALGDDKSLIVKGKRRLRRGPIFDESEAYPETPGTTTIHPVGNEGIPSGSGKKPLMKRLRTIPIQTDYTSEIFPDAPPSFFKENIGKIKSRPRIIQLKTQKKITDVIGVKDLRISTAGKSLPTPDKWPIRAAIEEMTLASEENPVPDIKLVPAWKFDIMRLERYERDSEWLRVKSSDEIWNDDMKRDQDESVAEET